MSTVSAATRVFGLPELLERIFLDLPPVDLFALRRVNHTFLNTLNSYASLRKRMYRELGGWTFSDLRRTILDPRLQKALYPFKILRFRCRKYESTPPHARYGLQLALDEAWIMDNQTKSVRDLFPGAFLRNIQQESWEFIGVTKSHRNFQVELMVAGNVWGIKDLWHPGDDSLRLYEVINKCMHWVSRGWKAGWQKEAVQYIQDQKSLRCRIEEFIKKAFGAKE